jgi:hypothetical protein
VRFADNSEIVPIKQRQTGPDVGTAITLQVGWIFNHQERNYLLE